jgi:hypothetical protein
MSLSGSFLALQRAAAYARLERSAAVKEEEVQTFRGVIHVKEAEAGDITCLIVDGKARFAWCFHSIDTDVLSSVWDAACSELPVDLGFEKEDVDALATKMIFDVFSDSEELKQSLDLRVDGSPRSACEIQDILAGELLSAVHAAAAFTGGSSSSNIFTDEVLARALASSEASEDSVHDVAPRCDKRSICREEPSTVKLNFLLPPRVAPPSSSLSDPAQSARSQAFQDDVRTVAGSIDCICGSSTRSHSRACSDSMYQSARLRVATLSQKRASLLQSAARAYRSNCTGSSAVAGSYAERARDVTLEIRKANEIASHAMLYVRNPSNATLLATVHGHWRELDLHGLTFEGVLSVLPDFFSRVQTETGVRIITGKGAGRVRTAALKFLQDNGYRFRTPTDGTIDVHLR